MSFLGYKGTPVFPGYPPKTRMITLNNTVQHFRSQLLGNYNIGCSFRLVDGPQLLSRTGLEDEKEG